MKTMTILEDYRTFVNVYEALKPISRKLHKIAEADCNFGPNDKREIREAKLLETASVLAQQLGLQVYHQTDPRGCALYLVDAETGDNYTNGIAIV